MKATFLTVKRSQNSLPSEIFRTLFWKLFYSIKTLVSIYVDSNILKCLDPPIFFLLKWNYLLRNNEFSVLLFNLGSIPSTFTTLSAYARDMMVGIYLLILWLHRFYGPWIHYIANYLIYKMIYTKVLTLTCTLSTIFK